MCKSHERVIHREEKVAYYLKRDVKPISCICYPLKAHPTTSIAESSPYSSPFVSIASNTICSHTTDISLVAPSVVAQASNVTIAHG